MRANECIEFFERAIIGPFDMGPKNDSFVAVLAIDVDRGDTFGMFIKTRPGKLHVRRSQKRHALGDHCKRFDEEGGPSRGRVAGEPGADERGQMHLPFGRDARNAGTKIHQIDDEASKTADGKVPAVAARHNCGVVTESGLIRKLSHRKVARLQPGVTAPPVGGLFHERDSISKNVNHEGIKTPRNHDEDLIAGQTAVCEGDRATALLKAMAVVGSVPIATGAVAVIAGATSIAATWYRTGVWRTPRMVDRLRTIDHCTARALTGQDIALAERHVTVAELRQLGDDGISDATQGDDDPDDHDRHDQDVLDSDHEPVVIIPQ
jgi:hypothetical protein